MRRVLTRGSEIDRTDIFERMTEAEIEELFDRDGDVMTVKSWIKEGIKWHVGDVGESEIRGRTGAPGYRGGEQLSLSYGCLYGREMFA